MISCAMGGLLGATVGYLLAMLHVGKLPWGPVVGAAAGTSLVLAVLEVHRRINPVKGKAR